MENLRDFAFKESHDLIHQVNRPTLFLFNSPTMVEWMSAKLGNERI